MQIAFHVICFPVRDYVHCRAKGAGAASAVRANLTRPQEMARSGQATRRGGVNLALPGEVAARTYRISLVWS